VIVASGERARVGSAPEELDALLGRFTEGAPPVGTAGAAVTILVRAGLSEVETLLIERTERATDPASGQVAFPGGHVDPADGSLEATARRELAEEVGLTENDLAGPLRFVSIQRAQRFGLSVAVFAGTISPTGSSPSPLSRDEVAHVFWLPRSALGRTVMVDRRTGYGARPVPATVFEGHVLWGFTRRVLREFLELPPEGDLGGPVFAPDRQRERPAE
jgi:8-oxo-dGTP pyrophosphatase MutT (NUDIX family)